MHSFSSPFHRLLPSLISNAGINSVIENMKQLTVVNYFDEQIIAQWKRSSKPLILEIYKSSDICVFIIVIPKGCEVPWHSHPGTLYQKIVFGSVDYSSLQIQSDDKDFELKDYKPFAFEDAFASQVDDCVCRGGQCPRRQGCSFWLEKKMRDEGVSLIVKDYRNCNSDYNGIFDVATNVRCIPHEAGICSYAAPVEQAAILSVLVQENYGDSPLIQYYRADRIIAPQSSSSAAAAEDGVLYRLFASDRPLGIQPVHMSL